MLNANPAIKTVGVASKVAGRNELLIGTLYTEVVKNLESAKTMLMVQTPAIQNLDTPRLPLENGKKGKLYFLIIFSFVFESIFILYFLVKFISNHNNQ